LVILDNTGKIALKGDVTEILQNQFDELKSCNVRVPWLIDIIDAYRKITNNEIIIENSMNFQKFFNLISKFDDDNLKILQNIINNKEIQAKELQKYKKLEKKIEINKTYVKSLKYKKFNGHEQDFNEEISNENNIILETNDLSFLYPNSGVQALKGISIKIQKGDFIGLIGPNGSGKTTLLYLLANLYQQTSGEIFYRNQRLSDIDPYDYAKKVGFIFQNPENMIFKSTIKDEILYAPKNFRIYKELKEEYVQKLIDLIGNEDPLKNPYNLSWGQKRRLNLSSIFVYSPEIILLDEPFIGQDQKTIDSLIETLYIENKRGKTIIISSHDYHLLLRYTKRIVELSKDGTLQNYDTKSNYFIKHSNLGPIILLNEINNKLNEVGV